MDLADSETGRGVTKRSPRRREAANLTAELQRVLRGSNLSQSEICDRTGVDPAVLWRFVNGERTITVDTADRIIKGLRLTVRISK
jgi:transcriptional regulator with XRE-family HTH domain